MQALLSYLEARSKEASTWRGLVMLIAGVLGVQLSPEVSAAIISAGVSLSGLIGLLIPDKV